MIVVVYPDEYKLTDEEIDKSKAVLEINEDHKSFKIKRHLPLAPNFRLYPSCRYPDRHISGLKSIILATEQPISNPPCFSFKLGENDEI